VTIIMFSIVGHEQNILPQYADFFIGLSWKKFLAFHSKCCSFIF
jgi:hypothetical protein